ncbi:class II aldolase/adducin family protein [Actinomadura sp. LD22]|uniref:Class II aldolase/adducin family protein n=1 Tax=Actinomadura physcomitrii TaxID=2650748 RepID=A0A6I4MKH0_9ACTN|nr:class II aldolase/adducin family protein [Actinomadura physcomitrii]MWA05400.1 class II aldolase/adducin family protein [Actinomadura physcomitrii]
MTPAEQVALGCRILAANGNADMIWGHLSQRDPDGGGVWLKAAGFGLEEITPDRVIRIDRSGRRLEGDGPVHLEYPIHTEVMAARPDVGAVVHSHAESAVALAATGQPPVPIGHEGTLFWPPDLPVFTETGDLIRDAGLGAALAAALGERNAVLLRQHGLVAVGPDVPTAVMTAIFLEKACRMQLGLLGTSFTWSDEAEALAKRGRCYGPDQLARAWQYLVRTS